MKKAIPAFVMVAIVAAAQPAGAIDDGFRGPYRVIAREIPGHSCRTDTRAPRHASVRITADIYQHVERAMDEDAAARAAALVLGEIGSGT